MLAVVAGGGEALCPFLIGGDCGMGGGYVVGDGDFHLLWLGDGIAENGGFSVGGFFALFLAVVEIATVLIYSRFGEGEFFFVEIESDGTLSLLFDKLHCIYFLMLIIGGECRRGGLCLRSWLSFGGERAR